MSNTDVVVANLQGMYRDVLRDATGRVRWDRGWQKNAIVTDCPSSGGFMRGAPTGTLGIQGLQVGMGLTAWDQPPGPPPANAGQVSLVDPHPFTVPVADLQIDFLDLTSDSVSTTPTNRLQIVAKLSPGCRAGPTPIMPRASRVRARWTAGWSHRYDQLRDASRHCERPYQHARAHDLAGILTRRDEMAVITPDTFDPLRSYIGVRLQQGVPLVDADWNEANDVRKFEVQAFLKWFVGNGVPKGNDGFRIAALRPAAVRNFVIRRGVMRHPPERITWSRAYGVGRCLVDGMDVLIAEDLNFRAQPLHVQPGWICHRAGGRPGCTEDRRIPNDTGTVVVYLDVWERLQPCGGPPPGA